MDNVCVFMSTYNGEKYLREQIDSILQQDGVNVSLYIRDDGSRDNTLQIIEEYIRQGKQIVIRKGENIGFQKSFALISREPVEADYYAFADQDDVWKPDKLSRAAAMLESISGPALYGSNIFITDANLHGKRKWAENEEELAYKERIIKYCYALGFNTYACSMVWNRQLQELAERHMPDYFVSQDVYLTMLAGMTGSLLVDAEAMIWHRLHGENTAGIENNLFRRMKKGYRLYWGKERRRLSTVAKELVQNYAGDIRRGNPGIRLLYDVADSPCNRMARRRLLKAPEMKLIHWKGRLRVAGLVIGNRL